MAQRTGRPSKGDRVVIYTRVQRPLADAVRAIADETGMSLSDVLAALAAQSLGMPEHAPALVSNEQQELPLKTA